MLGNLNYESVWQKIKITRWTFDIDRVEVNCEKYKNTHYLKLIPA